MDEGVAKPGQRVGRVEAGGIGEIRDAIGKTRGTIGKLGHASDGTARGPMLPYRPVW